jgi:hypothetical protein
MKRRRRHAKKNPATSTWIALGVGAGLVGIAVYLMVKPTAPTGSGSQKALPPPDKSKPRPFGDPADVNSVAHACNTAWTLTQLGHSKEAAFWAQKCAAGGATVPTSSTDQFT